MTPLPGGVGSSADGFLEVLASRHVEGPQHRCYTAEWLWCCKEIWDNEIKWLCSLSHCFIPNSRGNALNRLEVPVPSFLLVWLWYLNTQSRLLITVQILEFKLNMVTFSCYATTVMEEAANSEVGVNVFKSSSKTPLIYNADDYRKWFYLSYSLWSSIHLYYCLCILIWGHYTL